MPLSEVGPISSLKPGDLVTEEDTPEGPWYEVLGLDGAHLILDGRQAGDPDPLPVTVEYRPTAVVRRRREG